MIRILYHKKTQSLPSWIIAKWNHSLFRHCKIPVKINNFIIPNFFYRFIGSEKPETYFTDTERTRVCYEILETAPYGRRQKGEIGEFFNTLLYVTNVCILLLINLSKNSLWRFKIKVNLNLLNFQFSGIERLCAEGVFTAAYPLHVVSRFFCFYK